MPCSTTGGYGTSQGRVPFECCIVLVHVELKREPAVLGLLRVLSRPRLCSMELSKTRAPPSCKFFVWLALLNVTSCYGIADLACAVLPMCGHDPSPTDRLRLFEGGLVPVIACLRPPVPTPHPGCSFRRSVDHCSEASSRGQQKGLRHVHGAGMLVNSEGTQQSGLRSCLAPRGSPFVPGPGRKAVLGSPPASLRCRPSSFSVFSAVC
jgi:hypothetical protein